MTEAIYRDDFAKIFNNEEEFLQFLKDRDNGAQWNRRLVSSLRFKSLDEMDEETEDIIEAYCEAGNSDILEDTMDNTQLVLEVYDETCPVRSCAIKTILDRAQISGNSLKKVKKSVFARILNDCLDVGNGEALIKFTEGKISAVHGGDKSDYAVLDMAVLFEKTIEFLRKNFPGAEYKGATFDHSLVTALWELSGQDELVETYRETLSKNDIKATDIIPSVRLITSDVGVSGVNLYPQLMTSKGRIIPIGSPLKLEHKNGAVIADFEEHLEMLYSQYENALKKLASLIEIRIANPVNTMLGVMKKIKITKKLAFEAVELFKYQCGTDPCTAHDIYYGIAEVIFMTQTADASDEKPISGMKIFQTEENVMKALNIRWKDYDIPGDVKW